MAATNRNLQLEAQRGSFREDLFFRLSGMSVSVPPLRDRKSEIVSLVNWFISRIATELGKPTPSLSAAAEALLLAYGWPGKVRELRNAIECAVLLSNAVTIEPAHLPAHVREMAARRERGISGEPDSLAAASCAIPLERFVHEPGVASRGTRLADQL